MGLSEFVFDVRGHRYNNSDEIKPFNKDYKFFQKKVSKVMDKDHLTTDFIEEEQLSIDIKINVGDKCGKISGIPLDKVGVFSYQTTCECATDEYIKKQIIKLENPRVTSLVLEALEKRLKDFLYIMDTESKWKIPKPLNVIVKIAASGNQKQLSVESQLLLMNNML